MSFDWTGYLVVATDLSVSDDESRCRTSISRAYYSAFHLALDWMVSKDPQLKLSVPKDGRVHEFVLDHFNSSKSRQGLFVAGKLRSLRRSRTAADYDSTTPVGKAQAQTSLDQAKKLMEALKTLEAPKAV